MATTATTTANNRKPTQSPLEREEEQQEVTPEILAPSDVEIFERVQLDVQIATAKKWPRPKPLEIIKEMIEFATIDEETATSCFYTYEHEDEITKKTTMEYGPSIRLAEIAVVCYRNIRAGAKVISNNGLMVQSQGFCFDLERNVATAVTADRQIASEVWEGPEGKRRRTGKYKTWSLDMQMKTGNAANSFAYRNNVFKVVPGVLIKPVLNACKKTAAGEGPIELRFTKAAKMFRPFGVTEQQLKTYIGKPGVATVDLEDDDIIALRGLFTNVRDGVQTVQELFGKIDKDGTDRRQQQTDDTQAEAGQADSGEHTSTAAGTTAGISDDTKGPFEASMFHPAELESLTAAAKKHGHVGNQAQVYALMGKWEGTKRELIDVLTMPRAK